jgi:hypothetical protein
MPGGRCAVADHRGQSVQASVPRPLRRNRRIPRYVNPSCDQLQVYAHLRSFLSLIDYLSISALAFEFFSFS